MKYLIVILAMLLVCFLACQNSNKKPQADKIPRVLTKADQILAKTLEAHGGKAYDDAHYAFIFRDRRYEFSNNGNRYRYTRVTTKNDSTIIDVLDNGTLSRTVNGEKIQLSKKDRDAYSESVNSVIYFATLPHKLLDPAVNLSYIKRQTIKNIQYDVLKITFDQDGGGKDFDDEYHYWINKADHTIDYLAYNYTVNGGGVRFRSAYNKRMIDGILFQDYVNYKADVGTPLIDLPALFEKGALKELSKIETEGVESLKQFEEDQSGC